VFVLAWSELEEHLTIGSINPPFAKNNKSCGLSPYHHIPGAILPRVEKGESVSGEELIAFCRERLAPHKSPKSVVFKDDLPRNVMGKVQKAELRKEVCSSA